MFLIFLLTRNTSIVCKRSKWMELREVFNNRYKGSLMQYSSQYALWSSTRIFQWIDLVFARQFFNLSELGSELFIKRQTKFIIRKIEEEEDDRVHFFLGSKHPILNEIPLNNNKYMPSNRNVANNISRYSLKACARRKRKNHVPISFFSFFPSCSSNLSV